MLSHSNGMMNRFMEGLSIQTLHLASSYPGASLLKGLKVSQWLGTPHLECLHISHPTHQWASMIWGSSPWTSSIFSKKDIMKTSQGTNPGKQSSWHQTSHYVQHFIWAMEYRMEFVLNFFLMGLQRRFALPVVVQLSSQENYLVITTVCITLAKNQTRWWQFGRWVTLLLLWW